MPLAHTPRKTRKDGASALDGATLERMYYYLKLAREAENRIEFVLYRQGKIVGGVYVGRGQEAIAVGSAVQLADGDFVLPSHRDFAALVIRGVPLRLIFANCLGRAAGPTRGREHTLHLGNLRLGIVPGISSLGTTCPVACGIALTFRQQKKNNVVLVHFGEGTTSRGDVHEAMNLAAVMKLPVVFICNNNAYAYSTPTARQFAVKDLALRGPAYGMPGVSIDGNDVLSVYGTIREAIARARAGGGPSFVECRTFRLAGHSAHDLAEYVPRKVLEAEAKKDPLPRFEKLLLEHGVVTPERIGEIGEAIRKELDEAVAWAEACPLPEGTTAGEAVYCGPECWWNQSSLWGPLEPAAEARATDNGREVSVCPS